MTVEEVIVLLNRMGMPHKVRGDEVDFRCWFGWKHRGGYDKRPSAGIRAGLRPLYNCFGCGTGGKLLDVFYLYYKMTKKAALGEILDWLVSLDRRDVREMMSRPIPKYSKRKGFKKPSPQPVELPPYPDDELEAFRGCAPAYIVDDRGVTVEALKEWDVCYDEGASRMIFPVWNFDKKLVGAIGRDILTEPGRSSYFNYLPFPKGNYLYGEWVNGKGGEVILVEGPIDALRLYSLGYRNVKALMGWILSPTQQAKVQNWYDKAIIFLDGDDGGRRGTTLAAQKLAPMQVSRVNTPDDADPGNLSPKEITWLLKNAT